MKLYFFLILIFFLSSCTSRFKEQCREQDWYIHGEDLGKAGKSLQTDHYAKKCKEAGVNPSMANLTDGYNDGIGEYCADAKGGSLENCPTVQLEAD